MVKILTISEYFVVTVRTDVGFDTKYFVLNVE